MAWTEDDLARIERAIAQGVQTVEYQDRTVRYRSISELLKARDTIKKVLDAPATVTHGKQVRLVTQKGFH